MEYKIFYAYQSDISAELNETFIENAINDAIKKIKNARIKLIKGFRGTSGQKPLAQTMFDQSEGCDIFIGDVTYTSSRNKHVEEKFFTFRRKDYLRRTPGEIKWSPNPNVLIETGYSWGKKDYDRTILVMNHAFGKPDDFPIDMGHIRFPVPYSLSEIEKNDTKAYQTKYAIFVEDLTKAIKDALKTTEKYHRERFSPFRIHQDWKSEAFKNKYVPTKEIEEIILKIRTALEQPGNPQRLVGPKNSGKTRLAYELYRKISVDLKRDDSIEKVLYYDLGPTGYSSIERQLIDLSILNQDKVIIIDNCDVNIHKKICDDLLAKNVRILTIDELKEGDTNQEATIRITEEIAAKVVRSSVNEKFKGKNAIPIIEFSQSNISTALAYVNSSVTDTTELSVVYNTKWQQLLGVELFELQGLKVLEAISIFKYIGVSDEYKQQAEYVAKELCDGLDYSAFNEIISILIERSIVKRQGDFIILETFVEELALNWWKKQTSKSIVKVIKELSQVRLTKQFSNRLIELSQTDSKNEFLKVITDGGGILSDYNFINTNEGAKIVSGFAELIPEVVIESISKVFNDKSIQDLREFKEGRRHMIWALEKLIFRKETFKSGSKILFRLALAENENIGNNATNQFIHIFQPFLSGTEVSLTERFRLIEELTDSENAEVMTLLFKACNRALLTSGFVRMKGAEIQAGIELRDYSPNYPSETSDYWNSIIMYLQNYIR